MTLYLHSNFDGTFCLEQKFIFNDSYGDYDYLPLEDNLPSTTTMVEIFNLAVTKYGCKKLILNF